MKMMYKGLLVCSMAILCAVAFIAPSEAASIRDCVEESGIDMMTADRAEIEAVMQECMEAVAADREAARADKREAREARKAQIRDQWAKKNVRNAILENIEICLNGADIDYETATMEDMMALLKECARDAGVASLIECMESIDYEALDRQSAKAEFDACLDAVADVLP